MDAIILFSHGSVLCGAERNLLALADRMRANADAPIVEVGFLNYTQPAFATAVERSIAQGAQRIIVAPYFLIDGKFVVRDLPEKIAEEKAKHPGVAFIVAAVIGFHESLADAILASAAGARPIEQHNETLRDAAEFCRESPKCPLYGSEICKARIEVTA